jgi:DNA-binding SARP family transcriptional activator
VPGLRPFFGHPEQIVAGHLPHELGMRLADVLLGIADELVLVGATNDVAALTVDELRHRFLLAVGDHTIVDRTGCRYLGETLAGTRIHLCGRLTADVAGRRIEDDLPGRQGKLLFAYLVVNRLRPATRPELIDALWGDEVPGNPESALSALLSKLRHLVEIDGRSDVRVVLPAGAWIDVEAASEALHSAEAAAARNDAIAAYGPARVAQHIGARTFLAGEQTTWIEEARRGIEDLYARALELVAQASLEIGGSEIDTAARAARALIAASPYREAGYRLLMHVFEVQGNRAEALQLYERLRTLLRDELGAAPSRATQELHRTLLGG